MVSLGALIFDLDGTLVDSLPLICESFRYVLQEHLPEENHDFDRILGFVGRPLEELMAEISPDPQLAELLVTEYRRHNREILRDVRAFTGVEEELDSLRSAGYRMAIVTSKNDLSTDMTMAAVGLSNYFEFIIAKEDTERHKPHPEPLQTVLRKMGVTPDRAAYVGDSIYDMQCAKNANCFAIGAMWGAHDRNQLLGANPDWVLESIGELKTSLQTRGFYPSK